MAEEKIVKINLRRRMKNIPRWKRKTAFGRLLRERLKSDKMKISQGLNEKIWSLKSPKVRVKIVKDGKLVKAEFVE